MSALAPAGSCAVVAMPAENTVIFLTSGGSAPTRSMPRTGSSSLICWNPISASPRATTWPTGSAGIIRLLPFISSATPKRWNRSVPT